MWGVTWYCTRAWTTYNISKQFPNCFQAKVDSLYGSNPFFQTSFFFIHRLGNIKVLSKLDPGGGNSLGNSWGSYIQYHISDRRSVDLLLLGWSPYVYLFLCGTILSQPVTEQWHMLSRDERLFMNGESKWTYLKAEVSGLHMHCTHPEFLMSGIKIARYLILSYRLYRYIRLIPKFPKLCETFKSWEKRKCAVFLYTGGWRLKA